MWAESIATYRHYCWVPWPLVAPIARELDGGGSDFCGSCERLVPFDEPSVPTLPNLCACWMTMGRIGWHLHQFLGRMGVLI